MCTTHIAHNILLSHFTTTNCDPSSNSYTRHPSSCNMSSSPRDKVSMPMLCYCKMIIYHIDNQISFPRISRSTQFHCRYHGYIMSFGYVSLHVSFPRISRSTQIHYRYCGYITSFAYVSLDVSLHVSFPSTSRWGLTPSLPYEVSGLC